MDGGGDPGIRMGGGMGGGGPGVQGGGGGFGGQGECERRI